MKKYRTLINVFSSILVLFVNVAVNFWLSPFIIENIGVEANGFVTLAGNFITYATLVVIALNSMAARFITLAYAKQDYEKANLYYNSVFWGNLIIVAVLFIPVVCLIVFFELFFDVPAELLTDVKILFAIIFASFFISTGAPNYDVGCFVSNRLDRQYVPEMLSHIIRAVIIFGSFTVFVPHVWYVTLASLIVNIMLLLVNCHNTHTLTPELKIRLKKGTRLCSKSAIKELVGSGMWSSVSNVGNMLLGGLDLVICNLMLGATAMGVLSVSKILCNYLAQFSDSLTRAFTPELTIDYAAGNKENMKKNVDRSMKLTACLMTIAVAGMMTFGEKFFALWVPTQNARVLAILSALSFAGYVFSAGTQILYNIFTVTNHVKESAIAQIICGVVSTISTILIVKFTGIGIYGIVLASTVCCIIRNMVFTLPMAAKWLGFRMTTFFPMVLRTTVSTAAIGAVAILIQKFFIINNWFEFLAEACVVGVIGLGINVLIMLSKQDRMFVIEKLKAKLKKKIG